MKQILFVILAVVCAGAFAQTQQGVVKTRGRMVNGSLVPGQRLSGATITLSLGNALVTGNQGTFSFSVPASKSFSLVSARKQGYVLADPEYTRRSFTYSARNPFYVVLEDESQRQADINAATRKVRKTLTRQLEKREEEIEALKEQNKLTEKEYQARLQQLYDNQSKSEQLVKEMAERYASTDYDQLDDFNRQVQMCIEEGELQKADSLIRSKGDMAQRVAEYHNTVAANRKVREELEQSERGAAKTYEDLSQDLYRRHEIFMQQLNQDSALYCLKIRADLDTTNVRAVWDYARLCYAQRKFKESEQYFHICLRAVESKNDMFMTASTQRALGGLYYLVRNFAGSEKYYALSLENFEKLSRLKPDAYREELARTYNNLGTLYHKRSDYASAEKYFKSALDIYQQLATQPTDSYRAGLALSQSNLGNLYRAKKDYTRSEEYFKQSLTLREELFSHNPDAYRLDLARIQNSLGVLYSILKDYALSEKHFKQSLEHKEVLFKQNPDAFRIELSSTQSGLALLYYNIKDYVKCEEYIKLALANKEILFKQYPDAYREEITESQYNLGYLRFMRKDYATCESYLKQAIANKEVLYSQNPNAHRTKLEAWNSQLAYACAQNKHFKDATEAIDRAIALNSNNADLYDTKGEILLMQGKNDEALAAWDKVLELNKDYLKENPEGTDFSNKLKELGLIK